MTPILYEKEEIDFTSQGLGSLVEIYDVDVAEQRNGLLQLTASYPVTGVRYDDVSVGRIILAKPNQRDEPHAFRITSTDLDIMGHNVMIEADSITYDLNHNIVKHLNVSGADGQTMMSALKNAIVNPSIFNFYSDINHVSGTSLDYVNPMEAVMGVKGSFLQIWGGELKRENRRVAMFNRRGRDNVATFRLGKNISGLKYKVDISSLVTRILPIKSVQENDTTTYLEGTPVSSQYINSYEQIYTIKVDFTDDTIKTVDDLNKASANWFVDSANTARDKPSVTIDIDVLSLQDSADYQDKFKDLESVALTDTVTVYVPEYGINVTAIVNELHFDPIQERVTKLVVGTAKQSFADSSRTRLSDLQDKIISVQNQADAAAVSANGKSTNYYGSVEPSHPQKGDTWFWVNGDKSGIKIFVNGDWVEPVDSDTQEKIEAAVTDAVSQSKAHTDEVKQSISSDIETAKSQAVSLASTAEANAKSEATSLFNQAQNYVDRAKRDINDTINELSVGGRNLYLNSKVLEDSYGGAGTITVEPFDATTNMWHVVSPQGKGWAGIRLLGYGNGKIPDNSVWAYSADVKGTITPAYFGIEAGIRNPIVGTVSSDWSRISQTGRLDSVTDKTLMMYFDSNLGPVDVYIKLPKLEVGNLPTDWTPAPEDVVLDYTTKDNQIKTTISQYQETNDGKVTKAQTDATTALGLVETKVSQTVYDQKTGELSHNVNEAKDTADKALRTIGDYKTSNDKRVEAAESSIERTARAITEKVSQIDYDKNNSKLNERFTKVEATADGASTTVGNLQTAVNNLGQVNQLFNTEFSPDFSGWMNGNIAPFVVDGSYNGSARLRNTATVGGNRLYSELISVQGVSVVSTSVYNDDYSLVRGYDQNKNLIGELRANYVSGQKLNVMNGIAIPSTVYYIDFGIQSGVNSYVSQPMLVFASTVGTYVQGNYNNNAALAQVKITADNISNFVRDSSGNISSDFQTALSKTSIITDSTLATSIQKQTATQITSALTDNNGKIISLINQDSSGVQIAGNNIVLNGDTTVTGDFYAKGGNFKNINASNLTVGTLNGSQVNITNINANNIVSGAISGANLNINLNTGSVVFQKGRINSSDYTTDINIDQGYISTANSDTRAILKNGQLQLTSPNYYDLQKNPYLSIYNDPRALGTIDKFNSAVISARDRVIIGNKDGLNDMLLFGDTYYFGQSNFYGLSSGTTIGKAIPTTVGGGKTGVVVVGGSTYTNVIGGDDSPSIIVGWSPDNIYSGNRVRIEGDYFHVGAVYNRTTSSGANVFVAPDGALVRSSSSSKYKLDIEYEQQADTANKLLTLDPATWHDKFESEQLDKFHKIGVDPERTINMDNRRYYGIIAEDLVKAGLEHLVSRNVETGEVEGVEYSKIGVALIPIIRDLRNRLNEQRVEIERLKEKMK